ncbi:MAG: glycosyltransferase family 2 protein [Synechococcus sp.]
MPALNESETIEGVVHALRARGIQAIRVVDNGSVDRTAERAKAAGAQVIVEPVPGYGQACWRGIQNINSDIEWVLFCDGDGSDDLSNLSDFFTACEQADFVLGDRSSLASSRQHLTSVQRFGNWLATTLIRWGWGYRYRDLGPFRIVHRTALEKLQLVDRSFGWTLEMQVRAVEENLAICEIPVRYKSRQGGVSKISGSLLGSFRAGKAILGTLARLYLRRWWQQDLLDNRKQAIHLDRSDNSEWVGWGSSLSAVLLILGAIVLAPNGDFYLQGVQPAFWFGAILMGAGFFLSWQYGACGKWQFWLVAIATRFILLRMAPGDDIWRYLWEGLLQNQGLSPYDFPPNAPELTPLRTPWWSAINHPGVTAIYPPLSQLGFRVLAWIQPSVLMFKLGFVTADLVICGLLLHWFGASNAVLYAWNPVIIYSFAGGAHYDSWFMLPIVLAWAIADRAHGTFRWLGVAACLGLSIAVKWVSLPLLGFVGWKAWRERNLGFALLTLLVGFLPVTISALPFCLEGSCHLIPISSSFVSNGRSAEFIPYLASLLWPDTLKANWIYGPPLVAATLFLIPNCRHFLGFAEKFFLILLSLSPIIHLWYFSWVMPFAAASRNWGSLFVSLSTFVYFLLPHRKFLSDPSWFLSDRERLVLWLPFVLGIALTAWKTWAADRRRVAQAEHEETLELL